MSADPTAAGRRWRRAAAAIAALGLVAAGLLFYEAHGADTSAGGAYQIVGGQVFRVGQGDRAGRAQTLRMGGQAMQMTDDLADWFGSLWHGERLAWTVGGASLLVAALCLHIGGLVAEALPEEDARRSPGGSSTKRPGR